jgi:peptide/nickel transport system substrate-binding protein
MAVEYWDELAADPNLNLEVIPSFTEQYFTMNNYKGPCTDENLRWAITYAVDYEACKKVCGALDQELMIGPTYKRDLKKAMEYKDKSAYAGKEVEITFSYITGLAFHKKLALVLQDNLKDIGIKVELRAQTYPTWAKGVYGGYKEAGDMYPYYAVPVIADDYGILYRILHSNSLTRGGSNLGYSNPRFDALLDQGRLTIDRAKRQALYEEAKELAVDHAAYVWLMMYPWVVIYQKDIKAYPYSEIMDRLGCIVRFYDLYRE